MVGKKAENTFKYVGIEISQNELFEVTVHQNTYTEIIAMPQVARQKHVYLSPEEYTKFRSLVGAINWLVSGTRPDLSYDVVEHSCKFKHTTKEDLFQCGKSVNGTKQQVVNFYPALGQFNQWKLVLFSICQSSRWNQQQVRILDISLRSW